uniref:C6 domain-containing protein n=1 Tax=Panagrolaimus sp. PS1159 TaxID=55785 RepID=A0AC35EXR8_9BILA
MFLKSFLILILIFYYTSAADTKKCPPLILTPEKDNPTPKAGAVSKVAENIQMPVTCTGNENKEIYMFFNGNIGGPSHPKNEPITANLHCIDGNWKYSENGVSLVVTEVSCISV